MDLIYFDHVLHKEKLKSVSGFKDKSASVPCAFGPSWLSNGNAILVDEKHKTCMQGNERKLLSVLQPLLCASSLDIWAGSDF